jgi:phosphoribosyl 1,2-cyclic phosphate phosphodiesterase
VKVTFLGTGTSHGIPVIACGCEVCRSENPFDKRMRSSIMVEVDGQRIVIDTGPDFRMQMLREELKTLDAVLFTHEHKDHTAGLDDIRAFNFFQGEAIDIYATKRVQDNLRTCFDYIFADHKYPGIPDIKLNTIAAEPFNIGPTKIIPIEVMHYKLPVLGFRIRDFVYITDANKIAEDQRKKITGAKVLVLNALRIDPHIAHFSLEEALEMTKTLGAEKTFFTHISHQLGKHEDVSPILPHGVELAYDGLRLHID